MSLETPEKIRSLQRKLYGKAKAEPAFRFYTLYDKICREDVLGHAYALARANAGAPGVDGVTFAQIEASGVEAWVAGLREDLVAKTYRPDAVRRGMIPKASGGGRPLGIRTIRDRVIQSGDGKRGVAAWPKPPRPSSTLQVKGRKRQVMVDTDGRGLILEPQPADVQDRDGAVAVLRLSRRAFPFVAKAFADAGYAGDKPATATIITVEIVRKPPDQIGFAVHPRRWVVERFFGWISRNRRLWKDPEATLTSARAFLYAASVMILMRRIARSV